MKGQRLKTRKQHPKDTLKKFAILLVALLVIFFLAVLVIKDGTADFILFLQSKDCGICPKIGPEIEGAASEAGIKFYKLAYDEAGETPKLIFVHNNTAIITGYRDKESLNMQMCGFMQVKKACMVAGEKWE